MQHQGQDRVSNFLNFDETIRLGIKQNRPAAKNFLVHRPSLQTIRIGTCTRTCSRRDSLSSLLLIKQYLLRNYFYIRRVPALRDLSPRPIQTLSRYFSCVFLSSVSMSVSMSVRYLSLSPLFPTNTDQDYTIHRQRPARQCVESQIPVVTCCDACIIPW